MLLRITCVSPAAQEPVCTCNQRHAASHPQLRALSCINDLTTASNSNRDLSVCCLERLNMLHQSTCICCCKSHVSAAADQAEVLQEPGVLDRLRKVGQLTGIFAQELGTAAGLAPYGIRSLKVKR